MDESFDLVLCKKYGNDSKKTSIFADVKATQEITDATLFSYVEVLEKLYVIKDIDAWTPQIRSKTAIR